MKQSGSRLWYAGRTLSNGSVEEFNKNCHFPICDLSDRSPHSEHNAIFTYNLDNVDFIPEQLGVPWEKSKDQPFTATTIYIGFQWDLEARIVFLTMNKVTKYLSAISEWLSRPTHILKDVELLYGKLLHACTPIPRGHAYLTGLK